MLHLKLHTTSTTGHVVVTVISVGHWQFCRRVFAMLASLGGFACGAGWLCLRRWVAFGRSSHVQERKARACCSCNAHVLARRSNSMLSCKSLWLSPALSCSTLTPMTSCEHNFSRIFSTTTCCLRLRALPVDEALLCLAALNDGAHLPHYFSSFSSCCLWR